MFNGKRFNFKLIQDPAVCLFINLLVHKSTELKELVNQQIIFIKTTFECVVDYIMRLLNFLVKA